MKLFNQIPVINCVPTLMGVNGKSLDDRILYFMKIRNNVAGKVFGYLTAIEPSHKKGHATYWLCKCKCGNEKKVNIGKLTSGEVRSCGCYKREKAKSDSTTHGLTGHPIWSLHRDIRNRCYNQNVAHYYLYGGRGVEMCDEWKNDFMSFYNWCIDNGWRKGLQIDKDIKAKELGVEALLYSPERCQFVTPKRNNNNRRNNRLIEFNGITKTLMQWSEEYNINPWTLFGRLKRGWPMDKALTIDTKLTGKRKC